MRVYTTPYEFVEYPKWVRLPDGREVVVSDKDEEDALLRGADEQPRRRARRIAPADDAGMDLA